LQKETLLSNSDIDDVLASRARRIAASAMKASPSPRARVKVHPAHTRQTALKPARMPVRTDSAKGAADDWQIVVSVEEAKPGDALDLLLRHEQAHALYRLASEHAARDARLDRN
jgi:hypothetical protein